MHSTAYCHRRNLNPYPAASTRPSGAETIGENKIARPTSPTLLEGRGKNVSIVMKVGSPASASPVKTVLGPKRKNAGRFEALTHVS
jgi:hypothetical protein